MIEIELDQRAEVEKMPDGARVRISFVCIYYHIAFDTTGLKPSVPKVLRSPLFFIRDFDDDLLVVAADLRNIHRLAQHR
jgi:hypothetical protein